MWYSFWVCQLWLKPISMDIWSLCRTNLAHIAFVWHLCNQNIHFLVIWSIFKTRKGQEKCLANTHIQHDPPYRVLMVLTSSTKHWKQCEDQWNQMKKKLKKSKKNYKKAKQKEEQNREENKWVTLKAQSFEKLNKFKACKFSGSSTI